MRAFLIVLLVFVGAQSLEIDLQCVDNYMNYESRYIKSCTTQSLEVTSPDDVIVSVNGENKTTDYESVEIISQIVNYVPQGFGKFFPKLQRLTLLAVNLQEIGKNDLKEFSLLAFLQLSQNDLTSLDGDLFEFNPKLYYVNFDNNKLKNIGEDLLENLPNIREAFFQINDCLNSYANVPYLFPELNNLIRSQCPSVKDLKIKYCSTDIEALENRIAALESLLQEEKQESKALYKKCDGILDLATKRLHQSSKKLKAYSKVEERSSVDASEGKVEIDLKVVKEVLHEDYDRLSKVSLEAVSFIVGEPGTTIKTVKFSSESEFTPNEKISGNETTFNVFNQQILFFPVNLGDHLPQLAVLNIISSGLYEIDARIFETLPELKELNIRNNKLQEIPSDTFNNLKNLSSLDLASNNIGSLETDVFKTLVNLQFLDLQHNLLVTINGGVFDSLTALKVLRLNENKLKFISANLFSPLTSLKNAQLTDNVCIDMDFPKSSLKEIEAKIVDSCIAPIELECKSEEPTADDKNGKTSDVCKAVDLAIEYPKTRISKLKGEFNADASVLWISNQQTLYLPFQLNQTFPKLTKIVVEHSKLSALLKLDFEGLKQLKHVSITFNNISSIEEETFDDVTQIEHLNIASNSIQSLPTKLFNRLDHLKVLILSDNLLKKFTASLLPPKNVIEEFQVQNNQLELIETKTLRFLRKAKLIDLTENVCIDMKYEKSKNNSRALVELSGEIDLNCSQDDMR